MTMRKKKPTEGERPVSLKILADYVGLCPATVSVVSFAKVRGPRIPSNATAKPSDSFPRCFLRAHARDFRSCVRRLQQFSAPALFNSYCY